MFATPDEAEHAFYDALEHGDIDRLMQVWADDEEIACIHPSGLRMVGHTAVQESWQQILSHGPLHLRPMRPLVMQSMMCCVHVLVETISTFTREGMQSVNCYATNVYHKGPSGWRLVLHHASPAPADAGLLDLHDVPDLLH